MKNITVPRCPKELRTRINAYFNSRLVEECDKNGEPLFDKNGKKIMKTSAPYTLTGLALALGLDSRQALFEFEDKEMQRLVKMAVMRVEEYAEERLFSKEAFSGIKLFLSVNFERWRDSDEEEDEEYVISQEAQKWTV